MKKGQGAFEYLLLIGGVLFLTVAVLMILSTSMTQTAQSTTGSNISGGIQTNISEYGTVATAGATTYPTATPKPTATVTVIAGVTVTVVAKPTATPTPTPTTAATSTPSSIIATPEPQKEDATKYVNWLLGVILVIAAIAGVKWLYDEYQHEYNR